MEFKAAGILTAFAPDAVREVRIVAAATTLVFDRAGSWDDRIDPALRLLHDAAPLRVLTATEVAQVPASEYAFDADSLHVSIGAAGGASFEVEFGGRNPLGSGRYARVGGVQDVFLLPAYVAEAWEKVLR